jgi:N-methylhydantoinase A/oxoprolinase/acetone carboxylase beta subunit
METSLRAARSVYFEEHGFLKTRVLMRDAIRPGDVIAGPAVVHQTDSTVLVPPGVGATALSGGSLMLASAAVVSEMAGQSEPSSVAA